MRILLKIVVGFLWFWYDFLIGDCWQLALGVAVVLGAAILLTHSAVLRGEALGILVAAALMVLVVSTAAFEWWRKSSRQKP